MCDAELLGKDIFDGKLKIHIVKAIMVNKQQTKMKLPLF